MDKNQVPQDDENLLEGKFKVVKYALDENGNYVQVPSVGWEPENVALSQAWEVINEKVDEARAQVLAGEVSPIKYYMEKNMMDLGLLSDYVGIPKRKIKDHLKPSVFNELKHEVLEKYAYAFKITVDELKKVEEDK